MIAQNRFSKSILLWCLKNFTGPLVMNFYYPPPQSSSYQRRHKGNLNETNSKQELNDKSLAQRFLSNSKENWQIHEGCSESNTSYFLMLTHHIRGRSWWDNSRGWTFLPVSSYMCCHVTDGWRGTIWQNGIWLGRVYEAKGEKLNSSM